MATYKSTYKRFNGTTWDIFYFRTTADAILETDTYKVLTATERAKIADNLTTFQTPTTNNATVAGKLVKTGTDGKIAAAQIAGGLPYLPVSNPTVTGNLTVGGELYVNGDTINLGGAIDLVNVDDTTLAIGIQGGGSYSFHKDNGLSMGSKKITNLANPTTNQDAATKYYVDAIASEGAKPVSPVKVATTASITLSGAQTIDGVAVAAGDRVLVKNNTGSANGIYTVATGAWNKVAADSVKGSLVFVEFGNTYNDWKFYCSEVDTWIEFSKVDTVSADNVTIQKSGTTFSVKNGGITNDKIANGTINWGKLATNNSTTDVLAWTSITTAGAAAELTAKLTDIYSAIKNLRGTGEFNTNNAETIAGAYDLAEVKNRTYIGSSDPSNSGYVTGDLFFQEI